MIGRNTQGVKIMNLEARQKVASMTIIPHVDESEIDEEISDPLDEGEEVRPVEENVEE